MLPACQDADFCNISRRGTWTYEINPARQLLTVPSPVVALPVPPLAVGQPPPLPPVLLGSGAAGVAACIGPLPSLPVLGVASPLRVSPRAAVGAASDPVPAQATATAVAG